jgi:glutathione S-transferase
MAKPTVFHIPVCPFCQRIEILLDLKRQRDAVDFNVIDITKPRPDWLLKKTGGTTSLPIFEDEKGRVLKESMVILRYLEESLPGPRIARTDPFERAVERLMITREGPFTGDGYRMVMNQSRDDRAAFVAKMDAHWHWFDAYLKQHNPDGTFLFDDFGLAEVVFTPLFMRFWFLDYYEGYTLPADVPRAAKWRAACLSHPSAQQTSQEEIVKLYYDYAKGAGNGALLAGRRVSSFVFMPDWPGRPMPPADKYAAVASDSELGLI